ncbi:hypothetical protein [Dongshaea marina]|uniref:hypothetical protein n=1 Tax=Dongshaea marina TaxID=2047966 RepID=UPI00131F1A7E|nr:hypothetical protein [Dongshaea marina]
MKKYAALVMLSPLLAEANTGATVVLNNQHEVQCNQNGWTGSEFYRTAWTGYCSKVSAKIKNTVQTLDGISCQAGEIPEDAVGETYATYAIVNNKLVSLGCQTQYRVKINVHNCFFSPIQCQLPYDYK